MQIFFIYIHLKFLLEGGLLLARRMLKLFLF
jgi:hypothetical protein